MAAVVEELAANTAARRDRKATAIATVRSLRGREDSEVGDAITKWLSEAYGWQEIDRALLGSPYRLLRRGKQSLIVRPIGGMSRATWRDVDMLIDQGVQFNVDVMAIAAPSGVPDKDELIDPSNYRLRLWGPSELELIYVEIEFEGAGVAF